MKNIIAGLLALFLLGAGGPSGVTTPTGHVVLYHYHQGRLVETKDLGIGTITNVGVMAMANDALWAAPTGAAVNALALDKYCAFGTGSATPAATDIALQTPDSNTPATGSITLVSAANVQAESVSCTQTFPSPEAVTEWGLINSTTLTASTGTPWVSGTATTGVVTGTPYTPSGSSTRGEEQNVFEDTTASPAIFGLCVGNLNNTVTVPAWYKVTDGTAAAGPPASGHTLAILPVLLDRQTFSVVNAGSGDQITVVFTLTVPSGS